MELYGLMAVMFFFVVGNVWKCEPVSLEMGVLGPVGRMLGVARPPKQATGNGEPFTSPSKSCVGERACSSVIVLISIGTNFVVARAS